MARSTLALAAPALLVASCTDAPTPAEPLLQPVEARAVHDPAMNGGTMKGGTMNGGTMVYRADLSELNGSNVSGHARILLKANGSFQVVLDAQGLTPGEIHPQHIHGFINPVEPSQCPTVATDDVDGSGFVEVGEGADGIGQDYGPVLVPLDGSLDVAEGLGEIGTFPVANRGGNYLYKESIAMGDVAVNGEATFGDLDLSEHAIVLHGMMVEGEYAITLPVACGLLSLAN